MLILFDILLSLVTCICHIVLWQEFINKCEMLIDNDGLHERLRLNAQQYVQQHHNSEFEKQQYINVIRELISVTEK